MRAYITHPRTIRILLIISLTFNVAFAITFAVRSYWHHESGLGHGERDRYGSLHEQLNLTKEQAEQMKAAKDELLRDIERLGRELTDERRVLADLLGAAQVEREAISHQLDRTASLQQEIQKRVVEHILKERRLLGPEQREVFNEIIRLRVCPHGGHGPEDMSGIGGRHGTSPPGHEGVNPAHGE